MIFVAGTYKAKDCERADQAPVCLPCANGTFTAVDNTMSKCFQCKQCRTGELQHFFGDVRLGANNTCHGNGGLSWRWGWNSHFFFSFLSSELSQIVETPCTLKHDTVCGCRKNQYQDGEEDLFYCRNCSSCPNGIIANCEYGILKSGSSTDVPINSCH